MLKLSEDTRAEFVKVENVPFPLIIKYTAQDGVNEFAPTKEKTDGWYRLSYSRIT